MVSYTSFNREQFKTYCKRLPDSRQSTNERANNERNLK